MSGQTREILELTDGQRRRAVIRVIGVGGGGCNTVNQMAQASIDGVDFMCANTDRDHLERCVPTNQVQLGIEITRGLGAGSNPEIGRQAAEEDRDRRSEEHTSELQSLMRISYAVFCLKKKHRKSTSTIQT